MTTEPASFDSPFGEELWVVLARYLSSESPPEEVEAVRQWLAEDARRDRLLATLDRSFRHLAFRAPADLDVEAAWRSLSAHLHETRVQPLRPPMSQARNRWLVMGLRVAAVFAIGVLGATVLWRLTSVDSRTPRTYATGVGRTDSLRLPDGSRVVLGAASRLTLAAGYGGAGREVRLTGEALFDVVHDAARPFTVRVGRAVIQDRGTTFAVREDGGEVQVVVTSGSVLLQSVVLNAGDRGTVGPEGEAVAQPATATPDDLAWIRGRLVFTNAPLSLLAADLKRWYGIELRIADSSLASRHLTASFAGESAPEVLNIIGMALGARIERRGDTAVVRAR
jgi:transmembrane sensor